MTLEDFDEAIVARDGVFCADLGGEAVLLDSTQGIYYTLSETAALVWPRIAEGASLRTLLAVLVGAYDVPKERALADLLSMIEKMRGSGVLNAGAGHSIEVDLVQKSREL